MHKIMISCCALLKSSKRQWKLKTLFFRKLGLILRLDCSQFNLLCPLYAQQSTQGCNPHIHPFVTPMLYKQQFTKHGALMTNEAKATEFHATCWGGKFLSRNHGGHTLLLSRERVNKGPKRMNNLSLSSLFISFTLRHFTGKTAA